MKGDRERCLDAGMDGYVTKPIQNRELLQAIATHVPAAEAEQPPAGKEKPRPGASAGGGAAEVVDRGELLQRLGGDAGLLAEVIDLSRGDCARLQGELRDAVRRGDAGRLARAAHTLKGMLGNLSASAACEAALRLEQLARQGDLAGTAAAFRALEVEVDRAQAALQELAARLSGGETPWRPESGDPGPSPHTGGQGLRQLEGV
jgi:HPt (histidine-containing phosphotransfer) domain-containing protein